MRDKDLWARLQAFRFDAAEGSAPFSVKLARAEGWSRGYTLRVIEEYRRFVYLTQVAAGEVTPSTVVDAAWHMHLTFTRSYWEGLCREVLGRPLHHDPCAGEEEMPRYRRQYDATRALYEAEFGAPPPGDIWGHGAAGGRRTGLMWSEAGMTTTEGLMIVAGATAVGAAILRLAGVSGGSTMAVLIFALAAFLWLFILSALDRHRRKTRRTGRADGGGGFVGGCASGSMGDRRSGRADADGQGGDGGGDGGGGGCGGGCGGGGG